MASFLCSQVYLVFTHSIVTCNILFLFNHAAATVVESDGNCEDDLRLYWCGLIVRIWTRLNETTDAKSRRVGCFGERPDVVIGEDWYVGFNATAVESLTRGNQNVSLPVFRGRLTNLTACLSQVTYNRLFRHVTCTNKIRYTNSYQLIVWKGNIAVRIIRKIRKACFSFL